MGLRLLKLNRLKTITNTNLTFFALQSTMVDNSVRKTSTVVFLNVICNLDEKIRLVD